VALPRVNTGAAGGPSAWRGARSCLCSSRATPLVPLPLFAGELAWQVGSRARTLYTAERGARSCLCTSCSPPLVPLPLLAGVCRHGRRTAAAAAHPFSPFPLLSGLLAWRARRSSRSRAPPPSPPSPCLQVCLWHDRHAAAAVTSPCFQACWPFRGVGAAAAHPHVRQLITKQQLF
jgi:hypothetical protein